MLYFWIVVGYVLFIWVVLRVTVPNLGFTRRPIPKELPVELEKTIQRINAAAIDDQDFLKKSYEFVTHTYSGSRIRTITNFWVAFIDPIGRMPGFLPCTSQNYILRTMLIKSGRFTEEDIEIKTVPFNIFIHQYLRVRANGNWIDVDAWAAYLGVPLGKRKAYIG